MSSSQSPQPNSDPTSSQNNTDEQQSTPSSSLPPNNANGAPSTSTSSAESKMKNLFANEETRVKFCSLYEELLDTLSEAFPECNLTKSKLLEYREQVKLSEENQENLIKSWHKGLVPYYKIADSQDVAFWDAPIPFLSEIKINEKVRYKDFDADSLQVLWEYVEGMNRHSRIYNAIPDHMLSQIQNTAMEYVDKLRRGETKFDLQNLDWGELKTLGKNLMDSINPDDLKEFSGNITGLAQSFKVNDMQDIMGLLGNLGVNQEMFSGSENAMGLFSQLLQDESTQSILQNVGKMFGNMSNPSDPSDPHSDS